MMKIIGFKWFYGTTSTCGEVKLETKWWSLQGGAVSRALWPVLPSHPANWVSHDNEQIAWTHTPVLVLFENVVIMLNSLTKQSTLIAFVCILQLLSPWQVPICEGCMCQASLDITKSFMLPWRYYLRGGGRWWRRLRVTSQSSTAAFPDMQWYGDDSHEACNSCLEF